MSFDKDTIKKIRQGYYSALYFNRTKLILEKENNYKSVTMQIFQKNNATLCGIDEVIELLRIGTGHFHKNKWVNKFKSLTIEHLNDGDKINPYESIMHISGPYAYFAHLESLYLGILARRTLVATNSEKVLKAANGKKIIFFADRFDHFANQEGDGYAAHIGGIETVCTQAQANLWNGNVAGTIPHALIAINDGDTVRATQQFMRHITGPVIALVDFDNDCIQTSLKVAKELKDKLWGVRVDTSESLVDKSVKNKRLTGVNPPLIKLLRKSLDVNGFQHIKIIVSGGFNEDKIKLFEKEKTPVDIYGVGSSLLKGSNDFTADIVMVENRKIAKYGRVYRPIKSYSL